MLGRVCTAKIAMVNGNIFVIQREGGWLRILGVGQLRVRKRCDVSLRLQVGVSGGEEDRN